MKKIRKLEFEEIHEKQPDLKTLQKIQPMPVVVIADNIRSLHNVGALFRTSDAVHIEHLYLCGITGRPPRDEIRKTSLGAEESVSWSYAKEIVPVIHSLRQQGYQIVVLEHTDQSVDFRSAHYHFPLALVIGNEYAGVQDHVVELADMAIEIPMKGIKQSLNVSVAYGVAVYELLTLSERQHHE